MRRSRTGLTALQFALLVALVGFLGYVNRIITSDLEAGDEFAIAWTAGDLWLHQRISPYDPRVVDTAQQLIFGRSSAGDSLRQPALFLLPLPSMLLYAPLASLPYPAARTTWMTFAEVCLLASVALCLRIVRWRGGPWLTGLILIFAVLWYHGAQAITSGSFAPVEVLLLTGALMAVQRKLDSVAGLLFGLAGLMPQLSILIIAFALLWGASSRRWGILVWSGGTMLVIYGLSLALMPAWPLEWIAQILKLFRTTDARPIVVALLDSVPGVSPWAVAGVFILFLVYLGWEWTAVMNQEDRWFLWTATLTMALTTLLTMRTTTAIFVVLLPGLILTLTVWLERWGRRARWWVGIHLVVLAGGLWWLFFRSSAPNPEILILFLPAPILILVELWWIRWWASRSTVLPL